MFYTLEIEAIGERKNYRAEEGSYAGGNFTPLTFISLLYIAGDRSFDEVAFIFFIFIPYLTFHVIFFSSLVKNLEKYLVKLQVGYENK